MRAPFFCICFLSLLAVLPRLSAQAPVDGDADLRRQVAALRDAVIQQTRQIDALTAEIERLGVALGQRRSAATPAPVLAPTPAPLSGETAGSAATPLPAVSTTPTPDPSVLQHTVSKGENLTIIAKKYNTTIDAIQKLNKITDARKMQVGQILSVPTPAPSPAASPSPSSR